ncbi:MAG TPA: hypothetical protein VGO45_04350 [Bacteroidia bacterium]|jgi:hypothetical protein|nr:hypothetical protein [Bacteroidia bacterium]
MEKAIHNTNKGMFIFRLDELHVCTLVETAPDCWEMICCSGKKRIGSYSKARKLTDDFVSMLNVCFTRLPEMKKSEQMLTQRFEEFLEYRMVS